MYLLILCEYFSGPVVIIFLYLFCSYHLQMVGGLWHHMLYEITTVTATM